MPTQWNQQPNRCVFSKVIECLEQNVRKQIDCKRPSNAKQMNRIFELKYGDRKLSNVWKYNQVSLVLAVYASVYYIKQVQCN